MKKTLLYSLFAALSIAINLAVQSLFFKFHEYYIAEPISSSPLLSGYDQQIRLWTAIFAGTGMGLVAKYIMDKRWIFKHKTDNNVEDATKFLQYTLMGIGTTVIFWGMEWTFAHLFQTELMTFIGGGIGLMFGYLVKYQLDKTFVFINKQPELVSE